MEGNRTPASPQLYDPKTGAPITLAPEHVSEAVAAGKAGFLRGAQIPAINPEGKAVTIAAEDAPSAFSRGYKLETPDLQSERFDREDYGQGVGNELLAGAAGTARGATLGLSDEALTHSGAVKPETLEKLKKYNPGSTLIGEGLGVAAGTLGGSEELSAGGKGLLAGARELLPASVVSKVGHATSEGVAKLIGADGAKTLAQKLVATAVPRAAGSALEGSLFGAGNALSEDALGDKDLSAESLQANMGLGAIVGGGLGTAALVPEAGLSKLLTKEGAHTAAADLAASAEAVKAGNPEGPALGDLNATQSVSAETGSQLSPDDPSSRVLPPKSIKELREITKEGGYKGYDPSLPQQEELKRALSVVGDDLPVPIHPSQVDALSDPVSYDIMKTTEERTDQLGEDLRNLKMMQKKGANDLLDSEMGKIAPDYKAAETPEEAGKRAIQAIKAPYEAEKKTLAPAFKEIDRLGDSVEASNHDVLGVVRETLPDMDRFISVEGGRVKLEPFDASMGVTEHSYGVLKNVLKSLQDRKLNVSGVRSIRDYVSGAISPTASGEEKAFLGKLRKSLMDYMQDRVDASGAEIGVRETFKRYAQNEEKRELAEYVMGGRLDGKGGLKGAIVPEDVLKKIFSDSPTVTAVKELVGPDQFKRLASDWLHLQKRAFTKDGAFSSAKFGTFLSNKAPELIAALGDQADRLKRIDSANTIMRILPDAAPINPPQTAKVSGILARMGQIGPILRNWDEIPGKLLEHIPKHLDAKMNEAQFNDLLAGRKSSGGIAARAREKFVALKNIEALGSETAAKISSLAKGFVSGARASAVPISVGYLGDRKLAEDKADRRRGNKYAMFQHRLDEVSQLASNPQALSERIASNTGLLSSHAPGVSQSLLGSAVRATQFLAAKAPKDPLAGTGMFAHTKKYQPSDADVSKWERYVTAVDQPLSIMQDLKQGMLTREGVEAVKTVYPKLYAQMTSALMEEVSDLKHDLPYQKRLQLSTFLGAPVDASSRPDFFMAMQALHQAQVGQSAQSQGMPLGRASKLKIAESRQTGTESILNRGSA